MLTDTKLRTLKPRASAYRLADANGLCIEVRPSGTKVWRYRYRYAGKPSIITLAEYPAMGLAEARAERDRLRALVRGGGNPANAARVERAAKVERAETTFGAIATGLLNKRAKEGLSAGSVRRERRLIEKDMAAIGMLPISDVTAPLLLAVLRKLEKRGVVETAHRARSFAGRVFRYAIATGRAQSKPQAAVEASRSKDRSSGQVRMNGLHSLLGKIHPSLEQLHGIPFYVFLLVLVLTIAFFLGYAIKGTQVWWQIRSLGRTVRAMRSGDGSPDPKKVGEAFRWEPFRHLWDEYADTLHEVKKATSGGIALAEVRATVPADTLFSRDVLVDSRLFDEFTRHLPGVLTGLGIIGTFAGLLDGLARFKPTPIEAAVSGLAPLLQGVQHAFVASGTAIACASGCSMDTPKLSQARKMLMPLRAHSFGIRLSMVGSGIW